MIEKDIIKDQKETIHRLQKECMEKTEIIEEMNKVIQDCNIQRARLYKALEEIRVLLEKSMDIKINSYWHFHYIEKAQEKLNEVLK